MFIMVEGPDGAGKSTLVKQLADARPYATVLHKGPPGEDPYAEWEQPLTRSTDKLTFADRWHWGELVYGPLLRGISILDDTAFRHVEMTLQALGTLCVYMDQPLPILVDRLEARGDDLIKTDMLETIQAGYAEVLRKTTLPTLVLREIDSIFGAEQVVATATVLASRHATIPGYIGHPYPRVLLVGEKRGGEPPHDDDACFVPRYTSSGRFLLEALPDPFWRQCGIVNALETDLVATWRTLHRPPIVALGRKAAEELRKYDLAYSSVPHPQWVRRFQHEHKLEYGRLIEAAVSRPIQAIHPTAFNEYIGEVSDGK
jgi:thymidylate kinase